MNWDTIKEVFYTLGSLAGILALSKPVFEQKFNRDQERAAYVLGLLDEVDYHNLEFNIWNQRAVPDRIFTALDTLVNNLKLNRDEVRFSGPLANYFRKACSELAETYQSLRELIQVNEWEPLTRDENEMFWIFNKSAFNGPNGYPENYDVHLVDCVDRAKALTQAYQRLQILTETHFLETPLARWILPRRFKTNNVQPPD